MNRALIVMQKCNPLQVIIKCNLLAFAIILLCPNKIANANPSVQRPRGSLNDDHLLDSILSHQKELTKQCQTEQARELAKMMREADHEHGSKFKLDYGQPRTYQLPAICLFLLNWEPARGDRLDMINWYGSIDEDDDDAGSSLEPGEGSSNNNNNHTNNLNRTRRAIKREMDDDSKELFRDYMFDERKWNDSGKIKTNSLTPEERHMNKEAEELAENNGFREAVKNYKDKFEDDLSPVILVPGLLGSRLQARLDKSNRVNVLCRKQSHTWQEMWLSVKNFLPLLVDCWFDNARMVLDRTTNFTKNSPGVTVRVPDFGSVESVRVMDITSGRISKYYSDIIDHYTQLGYTVDKNLLAAPYDFRLAPQQLGDYFSQLDELIMVKAQQHHSGVSPVTLVCHSMGCNNMLIYLRDKSHHWRKKYVRKLIALSSPWGGAFKALKALIVGDQLNLPLVSETKMRKLARSMPSISYLLPQAEVYAKNSKRLLVDRNSDADNEVGDDAGDAVAQSSGLPPLILTPTRKYDVTQINELLRDMNLTHQLDWFEQTTDLVRPYEPIKGLRIDCLHGQNVPTMESLVFDRESDFPDGPYRLINGDGDGTVNIESLKVCEEWESKLGSHLVRNFVIYGTNHLGILSHEKTLKYLTDDVLIDE